MGPRRSSCPSQTSPQAGGGNRRLIHQPTALSGRELIRRRVRERTAAGRRRVTAGRQPERSQREIPEVGGYHHRTVAVPDSAEGMG